MVATLCEHTRQLPEHLHAALAEGEEAGLVKHLDTCAVCQEALVQLAADDDLLDTARQVGQEPPAADPQLSQLLSRLSGQALIDTVPPDTACDFAPLALDFLAPPREPAHLGRLAHYEVTEIIARGGMGVALKAIDEKLGRVVCLKVLAPQIAASPSARQRFVREARAAAAIRSPHVVAIHAVEEAAGVPFLVMEHVAGGSLQSLIDQEGKLSVERVVKIGREVAAGLAAAHAQSLVHRDVKPANILLDEISGQAKLTDFGLARAIDDVTITREGIVAGTPGYMSPEQTWAKPVDHRTDLFSLGSVLYAMCTGGHPFDAVGGTAAVIWRIREDRPFPLAALNPHVPPWLAALVARLHAKDPADRPQSASEVADLLEREVAPDAELSPSPPASVTGSGQANTNRWLAGLAAAALCLALLAALPQIIVRIRGKDGQESAITAPPGATVEIERDGKRVASVGPSAADSGEFKALDGHSGKVWSVAFAAGGRALSAGGDNWVRVWDLESGKEVQRFDGHKDFVYALAVAPDGKRALSGSGRAPGATKEVGNWSVCLWDIESGKELQRLEGHSVGSTSVAFSRDGKQALVGFFDGNVRLLDVDKWTEISRFRAPKGLWSVCFSPDGTQALTAGGDNNESHVHLWSLADGKLVRRFEGHKFGSWHAIFLPDGRSILSTGQDATIRHFETDTGKQLGMLRHQGQVLRIAVTADGRHVLAGAWVSESQHNLRLFQLEGGKEIRAFAGHVTPLNAVALSPDGRWGLVGGSNGSVRIWKMPESIAAAQ